jgi:hypothetical protein
MIEKKAKEDEERDANEMCDATDIYRSAKAGK